VFRQLAALGVMQQEAHRLFLAKRRISSNQCANHRLQFRLKDIDVVSVVDIVLAWRVIGKLALA
jgi:hypothetical protein